MTHHDPPAEPPADSFARLALAPQQQQQTPIYQHPSHQQILDALELVYHPREPPGTAGAANCLNALLQGPYFDEFTLSLQMGTEVLDSYHLNFVLDRFNLSLQPLLSTRAQTLPHHEQNAFLLLQYKRWFTIRRFGKHWINLNDAVKRPCQILPAHLPLSLSHLQHDGCTAFIVNGTLPPCPADDVDLFNTHFLWNLGSANKNQSPHFQQPDQHTWQSTDTQQIHSSFDDHDHQQDVHHYPCVSEQCLAQGVCTCGALSDDDLDDEELELEVAYEQDLQAAIALSIADMQRDDRDTPKNPIKPLCIKKDSPSTSTVSSEPVSGVDALRLRRDDVEMSKDDAHQHT